MEPRETEDETMLMKKIINADSMLKNQITQLFGEKGSLDSYFSQVSTINELSFTILTAMEQLEKLSNQKMLNNG